jgi:hypothetical protein
MAEYKALVSFCGAVMGQAGKVIKIDNPAIASDLLRAGYIEEVKKTTTRKRSVKKNEDNR